MKRNKSLIGFLMVCLAVMSSFLIQFESNAATSYTLNSKFPQPYADEVQSGYLNLVIENYWSARDLCTIAWQIVPITPNEVSTVKVTVNQNSISFSAEIIDSSYYVNLWELQPSGYASLLTSALVTNQFTRSTSWNGGTIVGASVFGHCSKFSYYGGSYVPSVTAIWSEQGTQIAKYNEILNALNSLNLSLGGKLDSLITKVHDVFLQVDSAEDTLARIRELMVQYYPSFETELQNIVDRLDTLIEQSSDDKNATDKFASDSKSQSESINDLNQQLQSEKIDIDSVSGSVDSYIDTSAISSYSGVLASFTGNPHILQFILIVLAVGLVSYVLFGKR